MNNTNTNFKLGSYCQFKGNPYLVIKSLGDGMVHIINPAIGNKSKRKVALKNCIPSKHRAIRVSHRSSQYFVTAKGFIVSHQTGRVMAWDSSNGDRRAIITEANRINKGA